MSMASRSSGWRTYSTATVSTAVSNAPAASSVTSLRSPCGSPSQYASESARRAGLSGKLRRAVLYRIQQGGIKGFGSAFEVPQECRLLQPQRSGRRREAKRPVDIGQAAPDTLRSMQAELGSHGLEKLAVIGLNIECVRIAPIAVSCPIRQLSAAGEKAAERRDAKRQAISRSGTANSTAAIRRFAANAEHCEDAREECGRARKRRCSASGRWSPIGSRMSSSWRRR